MNKISQPKVTIYYSDTCRPCHACMEWMDQEGIEYEAVPAAKAKEQGVKIWAVPTILIEGMHGQIQGFRRDKIKAALQQND